MGRYTTARSFDDRSTEVQVAPTEAEKAEAGKKDVLEVQNTMGSTAGAGSGDFHQYRNSRRKELFRLEKIEVDAKKQEEAQEFERHKRMRAEEVEAQRAKKADKRKKKKDKKRQKTGKAPGEAAGDNEAGNDDSDDDQDGRKDEDRVIGPALPGGEIPGMFVNGVTNTETIKVKVIQNVQIVDDDED